MDALDLYLQKHAVDLQGLDFQNPEGMMSTGPMQWFFQLLYPWAYRKATGQMAPHYVYNGKTYYGSASGARAQAAADAANKMMLAEYNRSPMAKNYNSLSQTIGKRLGIVDGRAPTFLQGVGRDILTAGLSGQFDPNRDRLQQWAAQRIAAGVDPKLIAERMHKVWAKMAEGMTPGLHKNPTTGPTVIS